MGSISEVTPATRVNGRTRATRLHVTRGGLTTLAFLLPMLVIFGLFAWFPIVRAFVMSVQDTNLVSDPVFVGLQNFQRVFADPLLGIAVRNTAWFAFLALVFGFPVPIILAVLMSELRSRRGKDMRREISDDAIHPLAMLETGFDEALLRGEVQEALRLLPPAQRDVIELIFWGGLTRREVAARLQLPLGTVHTRLRLGMEKLRTTLSHPPAEE